MPIIKIDRDFRLSASDVTPLYWFDAEASLCWDNVKDAEFLYLTPKGNWILLTDTSYDEDSNPEVYHDLISSFTAATLLLPRIAEIKCLGIMNINNEIALGLHRRTLSGPPGPYTDKQREALQEVIDYILPGEL